MESGLTPERRNDIIQQCAEHLRRGCNIDDGRQAIKAKFATLSEQEIDGMLTAAQSLANGTATATVSSTAANPVVTATQPEAQNFDDAVIAAMEDLDRDIKTLGITQEHMDVAENWIKARITDRALTKINQSLSAMGRRKICYQDIAAIALIHRRSVLDQNGESPRSRAVSLSRTETVLFAKPIELAHVRRITAVLETLGYTTLIKAPDHKNHKSAVYSVIDLPELDELDAER